MQQNATRRPNKAQQRVLRLGYAARYYRCSRRTKGRSYPQSDPETRECRISSQSVRH
jgi:hypothetical protein